MRNHALALACALTAPVFAQTTWQDRCFKNPGLPYCQGRDFAVKKQAPAPAPTPAAIRGSGSGAPTRFSSPGTQPALQVIDAIDWRFADPFPDLLMGFTFSNLSKSTLAQTVVSDLAARSGLNADDVKKMFDSLSSVDHVVVSVKGQRVVAMITGSVTGMATAPADAQVKSVPISGNAMLVGHPDAVDQALRRMSFGNNTAPQSDLTRAGAERQASADLWALGSPELVGAAGSGMQRFSMSVIVRDRLWTDIGFEFATMPPPALARKMTAQPTPYGATVVEGNAIHMRLSMDENQVRQQIAQMTSGPMGQPLLALMQSAKYLPARDPAKPKQVHPVIYGLDDGPREVK